MVKKNTIENVTCEDEYFVISVDGHRHKFLLRAISPVLDAASGQERAIFEISPGGYGIHWPLLDEDLSVDGLLGVTDSPSWQRKSA